MFVIIIKECSGLVEVGSTVSVPGTSRIMSGHWVKLHSFITRLTGTLRRIE
jgi:hypothetical protein